MIARRRAPLALLFVIALSACSKRCVWRPGGTSEAESAEDAISGSPECEEVRRKYEDCAGSFFDAKLFCGPEKGECVASARARIKCALDANGYHCSGHSHMFTGSTPDSCPDFSGLCTGKDRDTTVIAKMDAGHAK